MAMNIPLISPEFIVPAFITIGIPAMIVFYYLTKNKMKSFLIGIYSFLVLLAGFSILQATGLLLQISIIDEPFFSLTMAVAAVASIFIVTRFRKYRLPAEQLKKLLLYVGIIVLALELAVSYMGLKLPVMALIY